MCRLRLAFSLAWMFGVVSLAYGGVWDEHCSEGSQCATLLKNYANLVKGEECISFYSTGKCSRVCTFSLKSLINRNSWSKCSQRCEWSSSIVKGAKSWLAMCLANPAPDVFETEEISKATADRANGNPSNAKTAVTPDVSMAKKGTSSRSLFVSCVILVLVISGISAFLRPELKGKARRIQIMLRGRLLRLKEDYQKQTTPGKGPLDLGPDMKELRTLQRGARRHLKSLRSTLD